MHWVILIILVIILLIVVYAFLALTWLLWVTAVVTFSIYLAWIRVSKVSALRYDAGLSNVMVPSLHGMDIQWSVDYKELDNYARRNVSVMIIQGWIISIGAGCGLSWLLFKFSTVPAGIAGAEVISVNDLMQYMTIGAIAAGIINGLIIAFYKPNTRIVDAVRAAARNIEDRTGASLANFREVRDVVKVINAISKNLKIDFPADYEVRVSEFVSKNRKIVFQQPARFEAFLREQLNFAIGDMDNLRNGYEYYQAVEKKYLGTVRMVTRVGSSSLRDQADALGDGLHSENLRLLLVNSKWQDFYEILGLIENDLKDLKAAAEKCDRDDIKGSPPRDETDLDKACRIFGIPTTATKGDATKAYNLLVKMWHPDHLKTEETDRIRDLNWAKEFFRSSPLPEE